MKQGIRMAHITARLLSTTAALLACAAGPAGAQPGYYFGAHLGVNDASDWPAQVNFGAGVSTGGSADLKQGAQVGLALGRETENARFEVEYQHGRFKVERLHLGTQSQAADGSGHYDTLMLNAYRLVEFAPKWKGFAGAGIGWGRSALPQGSIGACNCFAEASDSGLAYQLRVGAEYALAPDQQVFAQINWLRLPRASGGGTPGVTYGRNSVGALSVGYRKSF